MGRGERERGLQKGRREIRLDISDGTEEEPGGRDLEGARCASEALRHLAGPMSRLNGSYFPLTKVPNVSFSLQHSQ